ncbi:hypothetical protein HMPREF1572_01329 [Gardnerella vaginalis JCP7275]|nr:hypothetical protein HMPREF1572_01329 [Gardnerella vaginalis JCP7275]
MFQWFYENFPKCAMFLGAVFRKCAMFCQADFPKRATRLC